MITVNKISIDFEKKMKLCSFAWNPSIVINSVVMSVRVKVMLQELYNLGVDLC